MLLHCEQAAIKSHANQRVLHMMDFSEFATQSEKDDSLWMGDKISLILNSSAQMATFETFVRTLENTR